MRPRLDAGRPGRLEADLDIVAYLAALPEATRAAAMALLGEEEGDALDRAWPEWAHEGQLAPWERADWRTWVLKAGRGFGKTLAGAQWVTQQVAGGERLRIALVGATIDDARRVMVEGTSGLLEVAEGWIENWQPSLDRLSFTTGAEATLFSGAHPDGLRGPEHHIAWCDELAKWKRAGEAWDMLQLGLRLGAHPRALVTTTPRPGEALEAIMAQEDSVVTHGTTRANPHTSAVWKRAVERIYAGTRLGRQELEGELLTDVPGALWTVEMLEACRLAAHDPDPVRVERSQDTHGAGGERLLDLARSKRELGRIVIGVDPPSGAGTCGILVCGKDAQGRAHVLADHSVTGRSPEGWARAVADAVGVHVGLDPTRALIVAEQNQGGKMVEAVLRTAEPALCVKLVSALVGKAQRAAPVAMLFEKRDVVLHGRFPALEAELLGMIAGGDYEGPGTSPDRADAMVWALSELMLGKERGEPRVRGL